MLRGRWVWLALVLIVAWIAVGSFLALRRHETFHTPVFDLGYFTQVIWNTSQGRWYENTLIRSTSLKDHFAPALAFLAPLLWLAPDARVLIVFCVVVLGVSILPGYLLLRGRYPGLALLLVLAFVLNPLLHDLALEDFHEPVLAALTLMLALYALYRDRPLVLVMAMGLTLLVREDMGILVASFGLYLLLGRAPAPRLQSGSRALGLGLLLVGLFWTPWIMLQVRPRASLLVVPRDGLVDGSGLQAAWGFTRLLVLRARDSLIIKGRAATLLEVFAPLLGLPLLASGQQLLWAPMLLFLIVVSGWYASGELLAFRAASLLPLLWLGVADVIKRLPPRYASLVTVLLLAGALAGFRLWSPFPGGGRFDASLFRVTAHHRVGHEVLARIPPDATLAAQDGVGAHLTTREGFWLFPWHEGHNPQWIAVDLNADEHYPFTRDDLRAAVDALRLDPALRIEWEQDGYLLFRADPALPPTQGPWLWSPWLRLESYDLAQTDAAAAFVPSIRPSAGGTLRVGLYWTALSPLPANYSVSVRLVAPFGFIVAQDDAWPGRGTLATKTWEVGRTIRDIHYVDLPAGRNPEELQLEIVVYDSASLDRLAPESGHVIAVLEPR